MILMMYGTASTKVNLNPPKHMAIIIEFVASMNKYGRKRAI
jgi:hypothetical protein